MDINNVFGFAVNETITIKNYIFLKSPVNNHLQNIFFVKPGQEMRSFGYCLPAAEGTHAYILLNEKHIQELVNYGVFAKKDLERVKRVHNYVEAHRAAAFEKFATYCDGKDFCRNIKESEYKQYAKDAFIDRKASITDWFLQKDGIRNGDEFIDECFLALIADSDVGDFDDFMENIEPNFAYHLAYDAQAMMYALRLVESYNHQPELCFRRSIYQKAAHFGSERLTVFANTAEGPVVCIPENFGRSFVFDVEEHDKNIWLGCFYRNKKGELSDVRLDEITEIRTEYNELIFR